MRIISGSVKGRRLKAPKGQETRPVLDQVKESIFNILPSPDGLTVLDLFAGTGSLGLEALSRGAKRAVFVENGKTCAPILLENLLGLGFGERAHLLQKPVSLACRLLKRRKLIFDWVFCDPPYDRDLVNPTIENPDFLALTDAHTTLIIEHSPRELPHSGDWEITDTRHYGQTLVSFLRRVPEIYTRINPGTRENSVTL